MRVYMKDGIAQPVVIILQTRRPKNKCSIPGRISDLYLHRVQTGSGVPPPPSLLPQWVPQHEADRQPTSNMEVKNELKYPPLHDTSSRHDFIGCPKATKETSSEFQQFAFL
jgi:hypothetical protein